MRTTPDYSDQPTVVIGVDSNMGVSNGGVGISFEGFEPPKFLRVVVRDYTVGNEEDENGDVYEDTEL